MILYRIAWLLLLALNKGYWRAKITGKEHIPPTGPFVLAPVHRSFIDFALTSSITRRRMRYMGKDSLWKIGLFGKLLSGLGAYPVHRGGADREALKRTVEVLEGGEPVVIFPEGTRTRSGRLGIASEPIAPLGTVGLPGPPGKDIRG